MGGGDTLFIASQSGVYRQIRGTLEPYFGVDPPLTIAALDRTPSGSLLLAVGEGVLEVAPGGGGARWVHRGPADDVLWTQTAIYVLHQAQQTITIVRASLASRVERDSGSADFDPRAVGTDDLQLLQQRARACIEEEDWPCAVETLTTIYEVNPNLTGDSIFYVQVIGASALANDRAADLRWTEEAVTRLPEAPYFWGQRARALAVSDDKDALLVAYERWTELDATDTYPLLAHVNTLVEAFTVDTAVAPLDMDAVGEINSLLTRIENLAGDDPNTMRSLAALYLLPAQRLTRAQLRPDIALVWLDQAIKYDVAGQYGDVANFFYGVAASRYLSQIVDDVEEARRRVAEDAANTSAVDRLCEVLVEHGKLAMLGWERMQLGQSVSPEVFAQLTRYYVETSDYGSALNAAYNCGSR